MGNIELDSKIKELRELRRMAEELQGEIDSLQDSIKAEMTAREVDTIAGSDYKITWKSVTSSRLDTAALKKAMPDVVERFTKTTTNRRFLTDTCGTAYNMESAIITTVDLARFRDSRDAADQRILELVSIGYTEREIAAEIAISNVAVIWHPTRKQLMPAAQRSTKSRYPMAEAARLHEAGGQSQDGAPKRLNANSINLRPIWKTNWLKEPLKLGRRIWRKDAWLLWKRQR